MVRRLFNVPEMILYLNGEVKPEVRKDMRDDHSEVFFGKAMYRQIG